MVKMFQYVPWYVWPFVMLSCTTITVYFCTLTVQLIVRWVDVRRMKRRMKILEDQVGVRIAELEETTRALRKTEQEMPEHMGHLQ